MFKLGYMEFGYFFISSGYWMAEKPKNICWRVKVVKKTTKKYSIIYIVCLIAYLPLSLKAYYVKEFASIIFLYAKDFIFLG